MTTKEEITQLYIGYFGRAPDPEGLAFWVAVLDSGVLTLDEIAQDFASQPEAQDTYSFLDADPLSDDVADIEAFITAIYQNLFDRSPEPAGLTFWTGVLQAGFPVGTFILAIIEGADPADAAVLENKTTVACAWSDAAGAEPEFVLTDDYIDSSSGALAAVTADPATVTAGEVAAALFFQEAPTVALDNLTFALNEDFDTSAGQKMADIIITDDGLGTNLLGLTGEDAALFEIVGTELFLKAGVALDFDTNPTLDVTVTVDDAGVGETPDDSVDLTVTINDVNEAPTVSLENAISNLPEMADTAAAIKVADIVVMDDATGTADLALTGGDAALFEIVGTELFLRAGTALDFESQASLAVTVTVDDPTLGSSPDDSAPLSLTITDENEIPTVTVTTTETSLPENTDTAVAIKVADITVTDDALGTNDLGLAGDDAAFFEIVGTELFLQAGVGLDFETNPVLDVSVTVNDATLGGSPDDSDAFSLQITDINELPQVSLTALVTELAENTVIDMDLKVADVTVTDDGLGANTLALTGADAGLFDLLGTELFLKAGTGLNFESNPALNVSVTIDDPALGGDPDDSALLAITVTDLNEAPSVALGSALTFLLEDTDTSSAIKVADILLSDDALGTNVIELIGEDAALFEINGSELFLKAGTVLNFEANPSLDLSVTVDDASLGVSPDSVAPLSIAVTDVNDPPMVSLSNLSAGLPEDLDTTTRVKVADIVITDDVAGSNTLGLTGEDAGLFEIDGTELFLQAGTMLDFESDPSLVVSVTIDDPTLGAGVDDSAAAAIPVTDVNEPPVVALSAVLTALPEDATTLPRIKVADILIGDDGLGTNALGLEGVDANAFEIDGMELFLKAGVVLDFETNPLLDVSVTVDDATIGGSPDDTALFALNITNVNEAPVLTLLNATDELFEGTNTSSRVQVATISLSDDGTGTNTLALVGSDAALFEIDGTGLFLKAGTVLNADANPALDVAVTVDDFALPGSPDDTAAISIQVEPGAPGAVADNTESLTLTGNASSVVRFGQINVPDADPDTPGNQPGFIINTNPEGDPYAGVAGSALNLIDTTGHDGLVSLGVIARVDSTGINADGEGFLLDNSGSAGDVEACFDTADVFGILVTPTLEANGEWTFDNSGATGAMEIGVKDIAIAAGGALNFFNVDILIGGIVDFSGLAALVVDGSSTIEVKAGAKLTLTVEQVDALQEASVIIAGEGTVCVIGESDGMGAGSGDADTDFANLQVATVDLSAVTLAGTDDGALQITASGATEIDGTTALTDENGDRVAQTIIGSVNDDHVSIANSAADSGSGSADTIDVITRLGADGGDIGEPNSTPRANTPDDATPEVAGDIIIRDGNGPQVQIEVDAGFDTFTGDTAAIGLPLSGNGGLNTGDVVQVEAGAEFYGDGVRDVGTGFVATDASYNNGIAVIEADADELIDVSDAGGSNGWTLIGGPDGGGANDNTLIGSEQSDNQTLVDGLAADASNSGDQDIFTGLAGEDRFLFNVGLSEVATFASVDTVPGLDIDHYNLAAAGSNTAGASLLVQYQVNNTQFSVTLTESGSGLTNAVDFTDISAVMTAIAADIDARAGVSAVAVDSGGAPDLDRIVVTGADGNSFKTVAITPTGTAPTPTFATVGGTGTIAGDQADANDDDAQTTEITVTVPGSGMSAGGEMYFLTVVPRDGRPAIEATYTASTGDTASVIAAGLVASLEGFPSSGSIIATTPGAGALIRIEAAIADTRDGDFGGFDVTLLEGQAAIAGVSFSSELDTTAATDTLAEVYPDLITDFMEDDDQIEFILSDGMQLPEGDNSNYEEDAYYDSFLLARDAANLAFANDTDLVYFLTGVNSSGDADIDAAFVGQGLDEVGLLFVDANGDNVADGVVAMVGIDENNFDDNNISGA